MITKKIYDFLGSNSLGVFLLVEKSIFNDKWQLMLEIGHHMFMVIDIAMKLIIISFERR